MPDPQNREASISGFHAQPNGGQTLWSVLEERGDHYSLMNVAFRNDPVWADSAKGLDLGCDGYRLWKKPALFDLEKGRQDLEFSGIELQAVRSREGIKLNKGNGNRAHLSVGDGQIINLTNGLLVYAFLPDNSHLILSQLTPPMLRGSIRPASAGKGFLDMNAFRLARQVNAASRSAGSISVDSEMTPSLFGMKQKESLMLEAVRGAASRLVIGYIPLIDEFNHVYMDQLEEEWPEGRVSRLYRSCMQLVDGLLQRIMSEADPDTLLVVSSDHGAGAFRSMLYVNELLADEGLVKRTANGYDLRRSLAYYHPSDCGLLIMQTSASRGYVMPKIERALDRARISLRVDIGMQEGGLDDSYFAFLYPRADGNITGHVPHSSGTMLDGRKAGGHHLSPLAPTPWMQAILGLWSPRSRALAQDLADIPTENRQLKTFLLDLIH